MRAALRYVPVALLLAVLLNPLPGGEKDLSTKGQVKIGHHKIKMENGKLYHIAVSGDGFRPNVVIRPGFFRNPVQRDRGDTFETFFVPMETADHRLVVLPDLYDEDLGDGPLEYTLKVKNVPLSEKPLLKQETSLTEDDPVYKSKEAFVRDSLFKAFPIKMKARQFYIIDMVRGADSVDPYLFLEDKDGKIVASDDDSGGNLNARLIYQPRKSGDFRIIATTLRKAVGPFTLTVRTEAREAKGDNDSK